MAGLRRRLRGRFDATTTIAAPVARDTLTLPGPGPAGEHSRRAGAVLVLGGDQAYPLATMQEYRNRLVGPFRSVLPWTWRPRWLFAIPGNHDWYDGLASFVKQFCQGRWIGGWKTAQTRSYFALALPHGCHVSNCGWTCTPGIHPAPLSPAPRWARRRSIVGQWATGCVVT
jgi:hypothetical protein